MKHQIHSNRVGVGIAPTIKAQYWRISIANIVRKDGLAAPGVIEIYKI